MKKMLALVLAAVMAFSMAACGGGSGSTATSGATSTDSTAASGSTASATGVTVQVGPNPETLDPALNSAIDGANILITAFEGLLIVDLLRRAGVEVTIAAVGGERTVLSSHKVQIVADAMAGDIDPAEYDACILPGGDRPGSLPPPMHHFSPWGKAGMPCRHR